MTYEEALGMAVEAMEKQIPMKPKQTAFGTECSKCGSTISITRFDYCPRCGQRIDRIDEESEVDE